MLKKADLHLHSFYSDGEFSPAEVVAGLRARGIEFAALTDHDTYAGSAEFRAAAEAAGILTAQGAELSASFLGEEVHILAYNAAFTPEYAEFVRGLEEYRNERAREMLRRFREFRMFLEFDEVRREARGSIGRIHFSRALLKKGYLKKLRDGIDLYMSWGKPCHPGLYETDARLVIERVRAAGGIPVLAHPCRLKRAPHELPAFIEPLAEAGLRGMEYHYPRQGKPVTDRLDRVVAKYGLLLTAGSDMHYAFPDFNPPPIETAAFFAELP